MDFVVATDYRVKLKESENRDKYLDFAGELKQLWNMKVTVILIVTGALGTVTKRLVLGLGGFGNKTTIGDHPNYSIVEIGQNTKKSLRDLTRFKITQSQWKTII